MSVSHEIDSLQKRASIISRRGYRKDWLIVYSEGLRAKIQQAEFALNELTNLIDEIGETVSATRPEGLLPRSEIYFYCDTFWAFLYSSLDVLAQVVSQALKLSIDEEDVTFGRLDKKLEKDSSYSGTLIQKKIHECKVSRTYHWLKKYRNCSVHRRRVYIGRPPVQPGTPEYHRTSSTGSIEVGSYSVGQFILCDDPYTLKPEVKKDRTIPNYMRETKVKIFEYMEKILKSTKPVR